MFFDLSRIILVIIFAIAWRITNIWFVFLKLFDSGDCVNDESSFGDFLRFQDGEWGGYQKIFSEVAIPNAVDRKTG